MEQGAQAMKPGARVMDQGWPVAENWDSDRETENLDSGIRGSTVALAVSGAHAMKSVTLKVSRTS